MERSRALRLDYEQIRSLYTVASFPASGIEFFYDVEAFRSWNTWVIERMH